MGKRVELRVPESMQSVPTDHLATIFARGGLSARTFFTGALCQTTHFGAGGHLHVLRAGALTLTRPNAEPLALSEPTLLFFPRTSPHSFVIDSARGADLACAVVDLGAERGSALASGLPEMMTFALAGHPPLRQTCELILAEAFASSDAKQVALDRLFEYLLIVVVRHVIATKVVSSGLLAGLADARLCKALEGIHGAPNRPWTVERMAKLSGMSRTQFAADFTAIVGQSPIQYLTAWRMNLARTLLASGESVKAVADKVGYDSPAAFTRMFARMTGKAPSQLTRGG